MDDEWFRQRLLIIVSDKQTGKTFILPVNGLLRWELTKSNSISNILKRAVIRSMSSRKHNLY